MKKIILFVIVVLTTFASCSVFYGIDLGKRVQQLELGMSRHETIAILGTDFYVESAAQVPEGKLEVLHFQSLYYGDYLLYFINGELTEFHRYIEPIRPEVRVIKEEK